MGLGKYAYGGELDKKIDITLMSELRPETISECDIVHIYNYETRNYSTHQ